MFLLCYSFAVPLKTEKCKPNLGSFMAIIWTHSPQVHCVNSYRVQKLLNEAKGRGDCMV